MKEYVELKCEHCGKTYYKAKHRLNSIEKTGYKSRFCSKLCFFENKKTKTLVKCLNCGREFYPADNAKYCSSSCFHDHSRKTFKSIPNDYFNYLLYRYKKHAFKYINRFRDITSEDELKEYLMYGLWLKFSRELTNNTFDIILQKDTPMEWFKVREGFSLGMMFFFNEVVKHRKNEEELPSDLQYMQPDDNYLKEKLEYLKLKNAEKKKGYLYLLKIALEGATIDDICLEEKLPYDVVYNRIYHLKECLP